MMSIEKLKEIIDKSTNIVFFGGAGVSTESGIPDFRSAAGLYSSENNSEYSPEYMLSHTFYKTHTDEFFNFYKNKMIYKDALPNNAHKVLAELEKKGKLKAVITQNIDGLHQIAGSRNVLELHGSIHRNYCEECKTYYDLDYVLNSDGIPKCDCGGIVKPDVVLYEEGLDSNVIEESLRYIELADVLIIGGTSLVVYPAASLIRYYRGKKLILINKSETQYDSKALLTFNDSIGKILGDII
ncbi:NAD-dependent protein deacylase [Tissierella sp. Yu-01]|uniref:NAD-dependent protein deacylase n=1 Tax=Tissierella sp. Yu-01 TaxID=3035694 RepID=UPI00240E1588|nr:NAD-dependent protein deacylase [Tissierella sp. Yu-01]WFA10445.1 NAD-dependent protein deacylase [Tissierella sp. Yu-01]